MATLNTASYADLCLLMDLEYPYMSGEEKKEFERWIEQQLSDMKEADMRHTRLMRLLSIATILIISHIIF